MQSCLLQSLPIFVLWTLLMAPASVLKIGGNKQYHKNIDPYLLGSIPSINFGGHLPTCFDSKMNEADRVFFVVRFRWKSGRINQDFRCTKKSRLLSLPSKSCQAKPSNEQ